MDGGQRDVVLYLLLNLASSFFLSAAHNVLFFVLDIRTPTIHWLHFLSATVFLLLLSLLGCLPSKRLPLRDYFLPVSLQVICSLLSSRVHAQNRTGSLYLIRLFDFVTSLVVYRVGDKFLTKKHDDWPSARLVLPFTLAVSLCWLEPGQLEYDDLALVLAPFVAFFRGLVFLSLLRLHNHLPHTEAVLLPFVALTSVFLSPFALAAYSQSKVEVTAAWESIDYTLMSLCPLFMALALHSEIWLLFRLHERLFLVADSSKWLLASAGQSLLQNLAHPSVLAFACKLVASTAFFRILAHRPK